MKKFFAVFIASCLLLSLSVQAFAEQPFIDLDGDGIDDSEQVPDSNLNYYFLNQISDIKTNVSSIDERLSALEDTSSASTGSSSEDTSSASTGSASEDLSSEVNPADNDDMVLDSVSVYSVSPITPDSTTGLKSVILGLIGSYDTIVTDYTYNSNNGYVQHTIEVQPDYVWMGSFLLLCLILYCLFRLGGAMIGGR